MNNPHETVVSPSTPLPKNYTFVPKGNVYITRHCRSQTHAAHQRLYIVESSTKLLGIRVPTPIYLSVLQSHDETSQSRANAVLRRDRSLEEKFRDKILKLFPKVPEESVQGILEHMLKKGSGRVGRVQRLEIDDAVILGVNAHIRHQWTEYDRIIKDVGKESARKRVERAVEQKFAEWEGKAWKKMEHSERRSQRLSKEEKDEMKFRYRAAQKVEKFERILEERAEKEKGSGGKKKKKVKILKDKEMARKMKLEAKRDEIEKKGEAVVKEKRRRKRQKMRAEQREAGGEEDEMDVDEENIQRKEIGMENDQGSIGGGEEVTDDGEKKTLEIQRKEAERIEDQMIVERRSLGNQQAVTHVDEIVETKDDQKDVDRLDRRPTHRKPRKPRRKAKMAQAKALKEAEAVNIALLEMSEARDAEPVPVKVLRGPNDGRKPREATNTRAELTVATDTSDEINDLQEQTPEQHRQAVEIAQEQKQKQKQKIDPYDQLLQVPDSKLIAWIRRDQFLPEPSHILQSILAAVNDNPAQINIELPALHDFSIKAVKKRRHLREQALLSIAKDMYHRRKFQTMIANQRVKEKLQRNPSRNIQKSNGPTEVKQTIVQAASLPRSGRAEGYEKRGQVENALNTFSDEENSMV